MSSTTTTATTTVVELDTFGGGGTAPQQNQQLFSLPVATATTSISSHGPGYRLDASSLSPSTSAREEIVVGREQQEEEAAAVVLADPRVAPSLSPSKAFLIIALLSAASFLNSCTTGLLSTSVPTIARDLGMRAQDSYWPTSVYGLTCGACLMLAGAVADVVGSKRVFIVGSFLMASFVLAIGLSRDGDQLVGFRALQGVASALCLPTSVSLVTASFPAGQRRNLGFACTGLAQPLGFAAGLVLGGVFVASAPGWRAGWYTIAGVLFALVPAAASLLPGDDVAPSLHALRTKVDWVGAGIACSCLGLLAFGLLQLTGSTDGSGSGSSVNASASVIAPIVVSGFLVPAFGYWVSYAERKGLPALVPNRLWRQLPFAGICVIVFLAYAALQTMELFSPLFFQNVQGHSALQTSLRLLPSFLVGVACNYLTGTLVHTARPLHIILGSSLLCAGAPLLMALINPAWPYWYAAFPAQMLQPVAVDVLFCVGLIVVSEMFPDDTQALAGAVFNTASQMGNAVGLAVIGVIADKATQQSAYSDKSSPQALGVGYSAGFWACFAFTLCTCAVAVMTMGKVGKVGVKRD